MLIKNLIICLVLFSTPVWASCYTMDDCFDVRKNNYTIVAEGYTVRAEGIHIASNENWNIILIKQQSSGFVRGINENDEVHWEERIKLDYDPSQKINPLTFSAVITRKCHDGRCTTLTE